MSNTRVHKTAALRPRERGFSMIELSVALVIALFLLNGMFMILQNTRNASNNTTALSQLQDEERMAMTMLTDVIQQAGAYPNWWLQDATTALPVHGVFTLAGQAVYGTVNQTDPALYGDQITVRYVGDASNAMLDCQGSVILNGVTEEMTFYVLPGNNNANKPQLYCSINGGAGLPLIPNVTKLTILYGVDSASTNSTNAYLTGDQVTNAGGLLWNNVMSVKVALTFSNPLKDAQQAGQAGLPTIPFNRVIAVQSKTGQNIQTLDGQPVVFNN
jgi:type IV pilus assembly protein PilW